VAAHAAVLAAAFQQRPDVAREEFAQGLAVLVRELVEGWGLTGIEPAQRRGHRGGRGQEQGRGQKEALVHNRPPTGKPHGAPLVRGSPYAEAVFLSNGAVRGQGGRNSRGSGGVLPGKRGRPAGRGRTGALWLPAFAGSLITTFAYPLALATVPWHK